MRDNFLFGMKAISRDMSLFLSNILHNKILWGFSFGIFLTIIIVGFFITKNPKEIPIILKYSATEGFQKLSQREQNGTYQTSYSTFIKVDQETDNFSNAVLAPPFLYCNERLINQSTSHISHHVPPPRAPSYPAQW